MARDYNVRLKASIRFAPGSIHDMDFIMLLCVFSYSWKYVSSLFIIMRNGRDKLTQKSGVL